MTARREALKYDKKMVHATFSLRQEQLDWLRLNGDQSARVRALIDTEMQFERAAAHVAAIRAKDEAAQ